MIMNYWISVDDKLPETGRYWCYVEQVVSLGSSKFQWNCGYNEHDNNWNTEGVDDYFKVTHWMPLPEPPVTK